MQGTPTDPWRGDPMDIVRVVNSASVTAEALPTDVLRRRAEPPGLPARLRTSPFRLHVPTFSERPSTRKVQGLNTSEVARGRGGR